MKEFLKLTIGLLPLCTSLYTTLLHAAPDTTAPTIAILDEGDGGDGFINAEESKRVIVQGTTSNVESGRVVNIQLISEQRTFQTSAVVNGIGQWSTRSIDIASMEDGVLTIQANVSNLAGVAAGAASNTVNLLSQLPEIEIEAQTPTAMTTPIIRGTTDQPDGTRITVEASENASLLCRAIADQFIWSCQSRAIAEGEYTVLATVTDRAGNQQSDEAALIIDFDLDDDGIADAVEGDGDADGDQIPNNRDLDSDGDFLPDALEGITDHEGDGLPNYLDIDSDNDGILDGTETDALGVDRDGDGIDDAFDIDLNPGEDLNGDSINDQLSTLPDTDQDGIPDYLDLDSDNDSLFDVVEAGLSDLNLDGYLDAGLTPINNPPNSDHHISGDDIPDYRDLDSNDDQHSDFSMGAFAIQQAALLQSNALGALSGLDRDADGIVDVVDGTAALHGSLADNDYDGLYDRDDLDDDNDGISDTVEGNGDPDQDGIPNYLDLDSDNDSIPDGLEGFDDQHPFLNDYARVNNFEDSDHNGLHDGIKLFIVPQDSDGDGQPDYLDLDSDNDGLFDLLEANISRYYASELDLNEDGRLDSMQDADADGLMDVVDPALLLTAQSSQKQASLSDLPDFDGDGLRDFRDEDSDGDGLSDTLEEGDFDRNGVMDWVQRDKGLDAGVTGYGSLDKLFMGLLLILCMVKLSEYLPEKLRDKLLDKSREKLSVISCLFLFFTMPSPQSQAVSLYTPEKNAAVGQRCSYIGLAAGFSEVDPEGISNGWRTSDDSQNGWALYAGYPFQKQWFGEFTYAQLGAAEASNLNPNIRQTAEIDYDVAALHIGYLLWPAPRRHNFFGKVGIANIEHESGSSLVQVDNVSDLQLSGTVGWLWQPVRTPWFARAHFDVYDRDAHFLGLSVGYTFKALRSSSQRDRGGWWSGFLNREPAVHQTLAVAAHSAPLVTAPKRAATKEALQEISQKSLQAGSKDPSNATTLDTRLATMSPPVIGPATESSRVTPTQFKTLEAKQATCRLFEGNLEGIRFEKNSSLLTDDAKTRLKKTVEMLKRSPKLIVEIQAYTDSLGSESYNQWLSDRRAATVLNYLRQSGLSSHQLTSRGYGESFPVAANNSEQNRRLNRRVQFQLINEHVCL